MPGLMGRLTLIIKAKFSKALDRVEQRLERRAAVDEDGGAARLVGHEIRVREPPRVHASLDQHARVDRSVALTEFWDARSKLV